MVAGHVRLRLRVRIEGSAFKAIKPLLEEFNRSEELSTFMPLLSQTGKVQFEAREIAISLPNDTWTFFDNAAMVWSEAAPSTAPGIFLGWFMYFGLWWFKELWAKSGNTATALKELLQDVMASGEIIGEGRQPMTQRFVVLYGDTGESQFVISSSGNAQFTTYDEAVFFARKVAGETGIQAVIFDRAEIGKAPFTGEPCEVMCWLSPSGEVTRKN